MNSFLRVFIWLAYARLVSELSNSAVSCDMSCGFQTCHDDSSASRPHKTCFNYLEVFSFGRPGWSCAQRGVKKERQSRTHCYQPRIFPCICQLVPNPTLASLGPYNSATQQTDRKTSRMTYQTHNVKTCIGSACITTCSAGDACGLEKLKARY